VEKYDSLCRPRGGPPLQTHIGRTSAQDRAMSNQFCRSHVGMARFPGSAPDLHGSSYVRQAVQTTALNAVFAIHLSHFPLITTEYIILHCGLVLTRVKPASISAGQNFSSEKRQAPVQRDTQQPNFLICEQCALTFRSMNHAHGSFYLRLIPS
jgi:hypothetical protein